MNMTIHKGVHCGINTKPRYTMRLSPDGGGKTGAITTRPDAVFGHRATNCTCVIEIYIYMSKIELDVFRDKMPDTKQGVEFTHNGKTYVAAIRRLTPTECDRLQGVPEWYNWDGISDSQHYKMVGNGWQIDTIRHCWSFLPKFNRPIRVWSLFDGMSCGHIVLNQLNIPLECYISSEIDKFALKAEKQNFPDIIQVGSIVDMDVAELVKKYGVPDFIFGGSPCQSFSFSGKMRGMSTKNGEEIYTLAHYLKLKAQGFEFEGQSYLFWEYMRILTELREYTPNILFFLENVKMLEKWERVLSHAIGIRGVHIDSALVSAQHRKRIYWSNIRTAPTEDCSISMFGEDYSFDWPCRTTDIPQPEDTNLKIKDVLENTTDEKYYMKDELVAKIMSQTDINKLNDYLNDCDDEANGGIYSE